MNYRVMPSLALLLATVVGLAACGSDADSDNTGSGEDTAMGRIEGSVTYRERMMLPPGAQVEIQLQDISLADAPADVLATVLLTPKGGPPYAFAIEYDPARIDPRKRYGLSARIEVGRQLMFINMDYIDPFAGNPLEVLVNRVPADTAATPEAP
jgi:putative lipoprotein